MGFTHDARVSPFRPWKGRGGSARISRPPPRRHQNPTAQDMVKADERLSEHVDTMLKVCAGGGGVVVEEETREAVFFSVVWQSVTRYPAAHVFVPTRHPSTILLSTLDRRSWALLRMFVAVHNLPLRAERGRGVRPIDAERPELYSLVVSECYTSWFVECARAFGACVEPVGRLKTDRWRSRVSFAGARRGRIPVVRVAVRCDKHDTHRGGARSWRVAYAVRWAPW